MKVGRREWSSGVSGVINSGYIRGRREWSSGVSGVISGQAWGKGISCERWLQCSMSTAKAVGPMRQPYRTASFVYIRPVHAVKLRCHVTL
jgi:hypothetical protein